MCEHNVKLKALLFNIHKNPQRNSTCR